MPTRRQSTSSLSSTSTAHEPSPSPSSSNPSPMKPRKSSPDHPSSSPPQLLRSETSRTIPIRRHRTLESSLATPLTLVLSSRPTPLSEHENEHAENPYPGAGTLEDPYFVDWLPDEAANPYNWKDSFRWMVTAIIALSTLCIAFASSSYSAAIEDVLVQFPGTTQLVGISGISFYVLGFGVGPLIWAPLSEMIGRRRAFNFSYPMFALFNMASALAPNIPTLLITRFLAGTFGASPLTNAGGQIGDMWAPHERALATSLFALAPFLGPVLGPIAGGFLAEARGFRWVFWLNFIFACTMLALSLILVPETYAPTLLRRKAARLQKQADEEGTGEFFIAKYDKVKKSTWEIIKVGMSRPFEMMFKELIVFCLGLYGAIIYGTLYLFFTAYPIVFQQNRGWSLGISGLAFLGIGAGLLVGNALNPLGNIYYHRAVKLAGPGGSVPPECRLPMACVGAVMLPVGLFVFAWTSTPNVHWIVPIIASAPFGCGSLLIFTGMNMYLIDSYTLYAASALAANAVMRSVFGTIFPLFSVQLYENLGLHWAGTLLAFLSLLCTPMPFLFMRYGPYLRRRSKYAPSTTVPPPPVPGAAAATGLSNSGFENGEKVVEGQKATAQWRKEEWRPEGPAGQA